MQPRYLYKNSQKVAVDEDISINKCTFPFKFKFLPEPGQILSETYVGVYISISYEINCVLLLQNGKKITTTAPFFVQCPGQGNENIKGVFQIPRPVQIELTPQKLIVQNQKQQVPNFKIIGMLQSDITYFHDNIQGGFLIEECEGKVRTIDLQLIRVEKIETSQGRFQEATEIQLIQVADGNVTRKLEIPLHMIFPVYFSCPNFINNEYQVDFEVNFIMILFDGFKITMNFPLNILRQ